MAEHIVHGAYFSPAGTTRTAVEWVTLGLGGEMTLHDLLEKPPEGEIRIPGDAVLVAGGPVYAGRIPEIGAARLARLKGDNTPAVALVVYGNRAYEDALLELCDLLEANGFRVIAAAAVVAQHSIFRNAAAGRPDGADLEKLSAFARACAQKLETFDGKWPRPAVKGKIPYRKSVNVSLRPTGDEGCTGCGTCARICPAGAIPPDLPRETDKARCIPCGACIRVCPARARAFRGAVYAVEAKGFSLLYGARKEPEFFL